MICTRTYALISLDISRVEFTVKKGPTLREKGIFCVLNSADFLLPVVCTIVSLIALSRGYPSASWMCGVSGAWLGFAILESIMGKIVEKKFTKVQA